MRVAVASGKGGTGKTLVSASLAHVLGRVRSVQYLDCDVEEPNGHLFLQPELDETTPVHVKVPKVDQERCTHCGECSRMCQFNAIASIETATLVFPELCHSCGGCLRVCPTHAITWDAQEIGVVELGQAPGVSFVHGRLHVGYPMSPPLIRAVKERAEPDAIVILDAPPGTSCPVVTTVRGCDLALLVTEPTPFGLHDLKLAVDAVRAMKIPAAVVLNREGIGDDRVDRYCAEAGLPIWARIPHDRRIAEAVARGALAVEVVPDLLAVFEALAARMLSETPVVAA